MRRPNPGTDCAAVLEVLEQARGEWVADMYGKTRCMVHSRIADLRRMGHEIDMHQFGKRDYRYRLHACAEDVA